MEAVNGLLAKKFNYQKNAHFKTLYSEAEVIVIFWTLSNKRLEIPVT